MMKTWYTQTCVCSRTINVGHIFNFDHTVNFAFRFRAKREHLERLEDFCLKAKAKIWL